ncbi:hypothetical protein Gotri_016595 [Gossypium trilobum]|uniref:Uncharacterized protein n=1 Tax=Gossypium trilobum TaxID=34281 RepID=A0A7J9E423_9ROSI|nr:hypothetical protein [Gossypium trilobum]
MPLWCICESLFKANNDSGSSSQEMAPTLGLGQIWDPINTQFFEGLELSQQSRRQYMDFEQSNAYDTCTQHIHCQTMYLYFVVMGRNYAFAINASLADFDLLSGKELHHLPQMLDAIQWF